MICKFIKIDHAEAWKLSIFRLFSRAEKVTTPGVSQTNQFNIKLILLQLSCKEMKIPS